MGQLLIRVVNNGTALNIGGVTLLGADGIGYWGLSTTNNVETDSTGAIVAVTLSGRSDHSNDLLGAFRFIPGTDVVSVQVGNLTTAGGFSSYLKS